MSQLAFMAEAYQGEDGETSPNAVWYRHDPDDEDRCLPRGARDQVIVLYGDDLDIGYAIWNTDNEEWDVYGCGNQFEERFESVRFWALKGDLLTAFRGRFVEPIEAPKPRRGKKAR